MCNFLVKFAAMLPDPQKGWIMIWRPTSWASNVRLSFNINVTFPLLDVEEIVQSLMQRATDEFDVPVWQCVLCGKTFPTKQKSNLRDHIEAYHVEGLQFNCPICPHVAKSNKRLLFHMKIHRIWCHSCPRFPNCNKKLTDWIGLWFH